MNSKGKVFLEKFRVKESSNLIGLENSEPKVFPFCVGWGGIPPIIRNMTKSAPTRIFRHTKFSHLSNKSLTPPVVT